MQSKYYLPCLIKGKSKEEKRQELIAALSSLDSDEEGDELIEESSLFDNEDDCYGIQINPNEEEL